MSDRDIEEQIDELITKTTRDLRVKILRLVAKHTTKLLKDQARELRGGGRPRETTTKSTREVKGRDRNEREPAAREKKPVKPVKDDDDSDEYYSE